MSKPLVPRNSKTTNATVAAKKPGTKRRFPGNPKPWNNGSKSKRPITLPERA